MTQPARLPCLVAFAVLSGMGLHAVAATPAAPTAASAPAAKASAPSPRELAKLCAECGLVQAVTTETRKGKASGVGAVGGAVLGGVLGNQVGGGTGKTVATVGGAAAGGLIGNEIEKRMKKHTVWITRVVMKDGSERRFESGGSPGLKAGDVVTVSAQGEMKKAP
jgi:outer membrane lipoprotein SlyB